LRGRQFEGLKFRRQAPIGRYIVDFACLERRLIVELDGGIHDAPFRDPERDRIRDAWLAREGYRVLRFRNGEVENNLNAVLDRIRKALNLPSPLGEKVAPKGSDEGCWRGPIRIHLRFNPSSVGSADTFSPKGRRS
jgi:very-short-patch-repair endonuclease